MSYANGEEPDFVCLFVLRFYSAVNLMGHVECSQFT